MLLSALQQRSDSVFVDLLTYSDLVSLESDPLSESRSHTLPIVTTVGQTVSTLRLSNCLLSSRAFTDIELRLLSLKHSVDWRLYMSSTGIVESAEAGPDQHGVRPSTKVKQGHNVYISI
jgi:hypothetical protein